MAVAALVGPLAKHADQQQKKKATKKTKPGCLPRDKRQYCELVSGKAFADYACQAAASSPNTEHVPVSRDARLFLIGAGGGCGYAGQPVVRKLDSMRSRLLTESSVFAGNRDPITDIFLRPADVMAQKFMLDELRRLLAEQNAKAGAVAAPVVGREENKELTSTSDSSGSDEMAAARKLAKDADPVRICLLFVCVLKSCVCGCNASHSTYFFLGE
jgi:hypothetical protein